MQGDQMAPEDINKTIRFLICRDLLGIFIGLVVIVICVIAGIMIHKSEKFADFEKEEIYYLFFFVSFLVLCLMISRCAYDLIKVIYIPEATVKQFIGVRK